MFILIHFIEKHFDITQSIIWIIFMVVSIFCFQSIWHTDDNKFNELTACLKSANTNKKYSLVKDFVFKDSSHLLEHSIIILIFTFVAVLILGFIFNKNDNIYHLYLFDYIKRQFISIVSYLAIMIPLIIAIMGGLIALNPIHILKNEDLHYYKFLVQTFPYIIMMIHLITIRLPHLKKIKNTTY